MGIMTSTKMQTVQNGNWNLPSLKDLLSGVEPLPSAPLRSQLTTDPASSAFLTKGQDSWSKGGEVCTYHLTHGRLPIQHPTPQARLQFPGQLLFKQQLDFFPHVTINPECARSGDPSTGIGNEPHLHNPPDLLKESSPPNPRFRRISMVSRTQPSINVPKETKVKLEDGSCGSSTDKITGNARHKIAEKHRRDGMGVFVQAADILRKGLDPATLSCCNICIQDAAHDDNSSASSPQPEGGSAAGWPKVKKTKSDMLESSLMWEFSIVLHMLPSEVSKQLDRIRLLSSKLGRERQFGLRNDSAKRDKWEADVRAEVLEEVLRIMEAECERHGVEAWGGDRQRNAEHEPLVTILTPLSSSSTNSPTICQKRSRDVSEEDEEDDRRVRCRNDAAASSSV